MYYGFDLPTNWRPVGRISCCVLPVPPHCMVSVPPTYHAKMSSHFHSFSSSVDATSYIYAAEIFPTPVRAKGLAVSISGLFIATIIFLQVAPTAFDTIGWKYYLVFICITSILFVVVWLYFPEVRCLREDNCLSSVERILLTDIFF